MAYSYRIVIFHDGKQDFFAGFQGSKVLTTEDYARAEIVPEGRFPSVSNRLHDMHVKHDKQTVRDLAA